MGALKRMAPPFGLEDVLSFDFAMDGKVIHFTGYSYRARKRPWEYTDALTDETFACDTRYAKYVVSQGKRLPRGEIK